MEDVIAEQLTLADLDAMCLRYINAAKSRLEEIELTRERQHREVDAIANELADPDRRLIADFEAQAEGFMRERLKHLQPGDKKSVPGLYFRVESHELPDDYERDEAALERWAEAHKRMKVKTTSTADWAAIKQAGRVVDGRLYVGKDMVEGVVVKTRDPKITVIIG